MKKVLIITSTFTEQDSVISISSNIIAAYKKISSLKLIILEDKELLNFKIKDNYDFLIIVHPSVIMNEKLSNFIKFEVQKNTHIIFYIFGDYVRKSPFYLKLDECLKERKVLFYAASQSYEHLIKKTLVQSKACLTLPFPINTTTFSYKKSAGDLFRKRFHIRKNDLAILYTGRISPQKNIHLLIKVVQKLNSSSKFKNRLKLFIWGNVDEFESSTFFEDKIVPGQYFQLLKKMLHNDSNIKVISHASHKELVAAYSGSNLFSSLSLYHDEDFGYSPLEALCTGTPTLLTNWGGYRDLQLSSNVHYIDVNLKNDYLEIDEVKLSRLMTQALSLKRNSIAETKVLRSKYSISNLSKCYKNNLNIEIPDFKGFSNDFGDLALSLITDGPILEKYKHFYSSFWRES